MLTCVRVQCEQCVYNACVVLCSMRAARAPYGAVRVLCLQSPRAMRVRVLV